MYYIIWNDFGVEINTVAVQVFTLANEPILNLTCVPCVDKVICSPFLTLLFSMSVTVNSLTMGLLGTYPYFKLAALFFGVMLFRLWKKGRDTSNPNGLPLPPGPKAFRYVGRQTLDRL
jgi:hypothetical protein